MNCPICGRGVFHHLPTRDRMHFLSGSFTVHICRGCLHGFLYPQPSDAVLQQHYPPDYYPYAQPDSNATPTHVSWRAHAREAYGFPPRVANRLLRILRARMVGNVFQYADVVRGTGRWLDVGCGDGRLLDEVRGKGWQTYGLDISPQACAIVERKGHHAICGELTDVPIPGQPFEVVSLVHSLEHMRDPKAVLRSAQGVLRPSGAILIETPNLGSWLASAARRWYWQLDSPRHLHIFSPQSLYLLARESGLSVRRVRTKSEAMGIAFSAGYFLSDALSWPREHFLLGRDGVMISSKVNRSYAALSISLACLIADIWGAGDNLQAQLVGVS